jgi:hypothetical protein
MNYLAVAIALADIQQMDGFEALAPNCPLVCEVA